MSYGIVGGVAVANVKEISDAPPILDQIVEDFEASLSRLFHAVSRAKDNADRLLGALPEPAEGSLKAATPSLAIDRLRSAISLVDQLTDKLHDSQNRLSRL